MRWGLYLAFTASFLLFECDGFTFTSPVSNRFNVIAQFAERMFPDAQRSSPESFVEAAMVVEPSTPINPTAEVFVKDTSGLPSPQQIALSVKELPPLTQREIAHRVFVDNFVTAAVLLTIYGAFVMFGLWNSYKTSKKSSPVSLYCSNASAMSTDALVCQYDDPESIIGVFGRRPTSNVMILVIGLNVEKGIFTNSYEQEFSFLLDIDRFVSPHVNFTHEAENHIVAFADHGCKSELGVLSIKKKVVWSQWLIVKEAISKKIQLEGFNGEIVVELLGNEELEICRNNHAANFVNSSTTNLLFFMSFVLYPFFLLYKFIAIKKFVVECSVPVEVSARDYLQKIGGGLTKSGFEPALANQSSYELSHELESRMGEQSPLMIH